MALNRTLQVLLLALASATTQAQSAHLGSLRDIVKQLPYQGVLPYVSPEKYPIVPGGEWVYGSVIQAVKQNPEDYLNLTKPIFDPNRIEIKSDMTQTQQEIYMGEKVLIKLIQKEGGKWGLKDQGKSAFGHYDPRICASLREHAADSATNKSGGHQGYHARTGRIEGLPQAGACSYSAENAAESWGVGSPPNPKDAKYIDNFTQYLKDLEMFLEKPARSCINSWKGSSGHYAAQIKPFYRFCYTMARGTNGIYYCFGLFTNAKFPDEEWKKNLLESQLYKSR